MKCYLVDDEPPALGMLLLHLNKMQGVKVIGTAEDPLRAIEEINQAQPDVVFLDIQMPELNGFEMLPYLKSDPLIIFCTAFDEYAVEAFKVNALDYLLKPIDPKRLQETLDRAHTRLSRVNEVAEDKGPFRFEKIVCFKKGVHHLVWLHDIIHFEKMDRYLQIKTQGGDVFMTDLSLKNILAKAPAEQFFLVNRGEAIGLEAIVNYSSGSSGTYIINTIDGKTIKVSRRRVQDFKNWIQAQNLKANS